MTIPITAKPGQPRGYGYIRVSTPRQAEMGKSIATQEEVITREWEHSRHRFPDLGWGGFFIERGASAYTKSIFARKVGRELNMRLKAGDHVFATRVNRMFRSSHDMANTLHDWNRRGIIVHFLDANLDATTPFGKALLQVMGIMSELDSDIKSSNQKEVVQYLKSQGRKWCGNLPFGYKPCANNKRRFEACPKIRWVMQTAYMLRNEYKWSLRQIGDYIEPRWCKLNGTEFVKSLPEDRDNSEYHWNKQMVHKAIGVERKWRKDGVTPVGTPYPSDEAEVLPLPVEPPIAPPLEIVPPQKPSLARPYAHRQLANRIAARQAAALAQKETVEQPPTAL